MPELPGFNISVLRERTSARPNEPLTISGRVSALGIGVPAAVRVFLEGPSYNPEIRTFDTFSSPSGDYSVPVLAEKGGQYQVYAQAFPPLPPLPVPGAPQPVLPPFAESPKPPLVIGNPVEGGVQFETAPGVPQTLPAPPQTPIEISIPITITVPGAPAPTPALPPFFFPFPPPEAPAVPAPPPAAAPAAPPAPAPAPAAPRGLTPGQLALATPSASPRTIGPGQTVTMAIPFLNLADFTSTVDSRIQVLGSHGAPVATLPGLVFRPAPGSWSTQRTTWTAPWDAAPDSYGLRVQAWDPQTFDPSDPSTYLVSQDFPDLFNVAAAAPAIPTPPAPPKGLLPEELNLLPPSASPTSVAPGQVVTFTIPFMNTGPIGPTILADSFVIGPSGAVYQLPRMSFAPQPNVPASRQLQWTVPATAAPGAYGLQVFAWDPNTFVAGDPSTYLVREDVPNLFTVTAQAFLLPGQLRAWMAMISPAIARPGETKRVSFGFKNTGPISPTIVTAAFVEHHEFSTVGRGVRYPLPQMSFQATPGESIIMVTYWLVPADAAVGDYDVGLLAWDPANPDVALVVQRFYRVYRVVG